jgi:hypothetical protein
MELLLALREPGFEFSGNESRWDDVLAEAVHTLEPDVLSRMRKLGLPAPDELHKIIKLNGDPIAEADLFYEPKIVSSLTARSTTPTTSRSLTSRSERSWRPAATTSSWFATTTSTLAWRSSQTDWMSLFPDDLGAWIRASIEIKSRLAGISQMGRAGIEPATLD